MVTAGVSLSVGVGAAMVTPADAANVGAASMPQRAVAQSPVKHRSGYQVVARGLDNPRQLSFAPDGALYIAESGHGGNGPCIWNDEHSAQVCFGRTGAVTRVHWGHKKRVLTGLPSLAAQVPTQGGQLPPGAEAAGPSDIQMMHGGRFAVTVGFGSDPANRFDFSSYSSAGHLLGTLVTGKVSPWRWPFRHHWRGHRVSS
ncbi:MAG: ScyD/ScyE family protein, partial [Nocardioidaceae bacterium]